MKKTFLFIASICLVLLCSEVTEAFSKKAEAPTPARVIVIDPGHGGKDAGAVSKSGIKEKDITLGVALELQKLLNKETNLKVILTRQTDREISLDKRARSASLAKADLFISIHVNSSKYRKVRGVETFFLSFEASSNEARMVAARENNVPEVDIALDTGKAFWEDEDYFNEDDIGDILLDMVQTESHHESARLAELIHKGLVRSTGTRNRGVRQAPFRVLAGTAVPAVLLELGFLSNKAEAKKLALPKTQRKMALAITRAIIKFDRSLAAAGAKGDHAKLRQHNLKK